MIELPCHYTNQVFQPLAANIPGATYQWNFGANAIPANATGYGPHNVQYTTSGSKSVKLVIHPNAAGAQCPDSSTVLFTIDNCPGQVLGRVQDTTGAAIVNVNVKLFVDADANGIPDSIGAIRNVFTSANGTFSMASLIPRNYLIIQTQPNNWVSFDDGDLTPDGDVLVNFDSLDNIIPVSIIASKIDSNNVFHEVPSSGSITGNVFDDINFNQVPNPGEGLQNVTVKLFADNNTDGQADSGIPVATTATTASGAYSFLNIPPGHYVLVETNPLNFISIQDFDPTADGDVVPNTNMNNDTLPLTLLSNESDMDNYFIDGAGCSLIVTNTNDSGPGSLRHAVSCAIDGDTIRFHQDLSGESITLESGIIEIDSDVVIMSNLSPRVTIVADQMDLFYIMTDAEVEFHSIDVTGGFGTQGIGAAFHVEGSLTLLDVDINKNPFLTQGVYLIHALPSAIVTMDGVVNIYE